MSRIRQTKTNFTSGEISSRLLGRGDLRIYENGALSLQNLFIHPTGGVTRRYGTEYIDTAEGSGRLVTFEFNTEQTYLLVFTALKIYIYQDDVLVETVTTPYTAEQIKKIAWTQSADTLFICHKDVPPKQLIRSTGGVWSLEDIVFAVAENNDDIVNQPFHKYVASDVAISVSHLHGSASGTTNLYASEGVFSPDHVGTRFSLGGTGHVLITNYYSPTHLLGDVHSSIPSVKSTNWKESAFSKVRGYPSTVAFHQDRLVFGGVRDAPNRIWFSKSGKLFDFDAGTGLDDEGISFGILSDQVNAITGVFSGRHLQVFTSGAEWMVTGDPLTPESVQVSRQTRVGSVTDRHIPPVDVDGATIFCARNGKELREFLYADVEAAYRSTDISLLARHIIKNPIDMAYNALNRLLFVIMEDGDMGVMTVYRDEGITAWTVLETQGYYCSIASVGDHIYFLVERDGEYLIEKMVKDVYLDSALAGTSASPKSVWTGLDHLEGQTVSIVADGIVQTDKVVSSGTITLDQAATEVCIGLSYTHKIEPLPPSLLSPEGSGRAARLVEATFRMEDTASLNLDVGRGLVDILEHEQDPGQAADLLSGDKKIRATGWVTDMTQSLWKIEQSVPLPFTLLSVTTETKVND